MSSHKQLANWYAQLGQHLEAGILLSDALRLCEGPPKKDREAMAERIQNGDTIEAVMRDAPKWMPRSDRFFVLAAMETGNLPQTLSNLSDRHEKIGATQLKVILGLLYPLGVFHIAALLLPIVRMIDYEAGFQWDPARYLIQLFTLLIPVWAALGLIHYLGRKDHPLLPKLLRCLPLLKKYSEMQALADLSYSLGTLIAAGVPAPSAWRLSTKIVKDKPIERAVAKLEPTFAKGHEPADQLKQFKCFPAEFTTFYKTGAKSGNLDRNLLHAGRQFQEKANNAMTTAAIAYPSLFFAIVAGVIIVTIFQVYGNYLNLFKTLSG
ncbi:MAG: type II secretion system F family protein [Verrucomicrobiota bacterium]